MPLFHLLALRIPNLKLRVAMVDNVTTYPCDPHFGAFFHPIDELGEETPLRVLEIPEVHFD